MYEIVVKGRLPAGWEQWFDGMSATVTLTGDGPLTVLTGPIADQAALHGALACVRDLALPVVSVRLLAATEDADHRRTRSAVAGPHDTSRGT